MPGLPQGDCYTSKKSSLTAPNLPVCSAVASLDASTCTGPGRDGKGTLHGSCEGICCRHVEVYLDSVIWSLKEQKHMPRRRALRFACVLKPSGVWRVGTVGRALHLDGSGKPLIDAVGRNEVSLHSQTAEAQTHLPQATSAGQCSLKMPVRYPRTEYKFYENHSKVLH